MEEVSEKTLSSCDTAAYLSWPLELLTGVVVWQAGCWGWDRDWVRDWGWVRPPKSTLRDLGKALKGPGAPEADTVRPVDEKKKKKSHSNHRIVKSFPAVF